MHKHCPSWLMLLFTAVLLISGPASGQTPPVPPQQQAPPSAPPVATPAPPPPGAAPQQPASPDPNAQGQQPAQEPSSYINEGDPFLKYATGVKVRVSQMEVGQFPTARAFVSVFDSNGAQIKTLKQEQFTISENNTPATDVHFAKRDELDLPLQIMIVVDISGSMEPALQLEVQAVRDFIAQLGERDMVGLISFSDTARTNVPLTAAKEDVLQELELLVAYAQTALWDAIQLGMEELLADPAPARRAMIVLSDGLDNKSIKTPQTILRFYDEEARQKNLGFSIYTLGLGEEIDQAGLSAISMKTGGDYVDSPSAEDLAGVYQDILSQIQNEYLLEYTSPITSTPGQIIDVSVGLNAVQEFAPGTYTYRSPGLTKALARVLWPGLITIMVLLLLLILATIYKLTRRVWLTVMLTPLEGKDYVIGADGAAIGTLESCQIRFRHDPGLLPLHATIEETTDGYLLSAVDPNAPVVMNGQLLARKLLRNGDRFLLGTTHFIFNERAIRVGSGETLPAEFLVSAPVTQITEAAQVSGSAAPASRAIPKTLYAVSGPLSGQRFTLQEGENTLGRTEGSIALAGDTQVSRKHCTITLGTAAATLLDPGSTNGTRLNGAPVQPGMAQPVYAGDELGIGVGLYRLE